MLRISKIADYAIVIMLDLSVSGADRVHTTRAIAERTHLPQTTVSKITQLLHKGGMVSAHRGICGGYQLAEAAENINLLQIIEAIEGPVSLTTCSVPESVDCQTHSTCRAGPHWPVINQALVSLLKQIHLFDLANSPTKKTVLDEAALPAST